ncbi:MAG TPA: pyruvate ferredoxin oxidoreductase [Euryarchaeota archaeon]|nr:pyruvate ferredoxin oxidoreductase [Euryarchaeota archaeon]
MLSKTSGEHRMAINHDSLPRTPIAIESSEEIRTGTWRTLKPVIDRTNCSKCMICWKYCPDLAIEIREGEPYIDYDYCKGCGICANECPKKCISLNKQELE